MCGIAGYVGKGDVVKMLESIKHRGPDQDGRWEKDGVALGCKRLAVIDVEGGNQPIFNEDGSAVIVFNGAIFNYIELRKELEPKHRFKTKTDTEVILHAYEEWGASCLQRFNGMFAFAIWNGRKLFIARDRMGEKPLYYYRGKEGFFFGSEIKALLTQIEGKVKFTPEFIAFEYPLGEDTYYENIKSLEPGNYLEYERGEIKTRRYWNIPVNSVQSDRKDEDFVDEFRELLKDSVKIRLRSDVPVGVFLSGGLDSALIAAIAKPLNAFTCRFPDGPEFDEWEYAKISADNVGLNPYVVTPTPENFRNEFHKIIWNLDGPISTLSSIAEFMLAKEARGKVKVIIGGQGADELFGGYIRYLLMLNERRIAESDVIKQYLPLARKLWGSDFGREPAARYYRLMLRNEKAPEAAYYSLKRLFDTPNQLLDKMIYTDIHIQLPALLTMNDRAAASYGLENRCPFLDHRIVEFAFRLPERLKIRGARTKWLLREAARGLIPDSIVDRLDKKGLVTPVGKWLSGTLKGWVADIMKDDVNISKQDELGIFDRSLYHALSLKIWERTRKTPLKPPEFHYDSTSS